MTKIEKLKKKSILTGGKLEYSKRLIAALGDPREWEYCGECNDNRNCSGICACGHKGIRFEFLIHNFKYERTEIVGSTCICHLHLINPEMAERMAVDYEEIQKKLRQAEAEMRKAAAMKEVQELIEKYNDLRKKTQITYDKIRETGRKAPQELWSICDSHRYGISMDGEKIIKKYKRPCDMKRKLKAKISELETVLEIDYSEFLKEQKDENGNSNGNSKKTFQIFGDIRDVTVEIEHETDKAWFLFEKESGLAAWIPKKSVRKDKKINRNWIEKFGSTQMTVVGC